MSVPPPNTCTFATDHLKSLPFQQGPGDVMELHFCAPKPGLYQLSIIADAQEFDWDELYFELHLFGNQGQRTGPWDFDLRDGNKPLVPSYWVSLNGERIGLWFFARVSVEDVEAKRFRGRMAFELQTEGAATLSLTPYRPLPIRWLSARLEPDPEDHLASATPPAPPQCTLSFWSEPTYWEGMRERLQTTHAIYAAPLRGAFQWVCSRPYHRPNQLALLLAYWKLEGSPEALSLALKAIDQWIALPHWGNPKEDGYSHDGDMGAAHTLGALTLAYHAVGPQLGPERKARMAEKMALQGTRFIKQALLNRDYWGGSVLQDHGWRAVFTFGAVTLNLLGHLPEAQHWARWVIPRAQRALEAMPRDGVIPLSSYGSPMLYLDDLVDYRDARLHTCGEDILEQPPFREIVTYLYNVFHPEQACLIVSGIEAGHFVGGHAFLNQMAARFQDPRPALLQEQILIRRAHHPPLQGQYEEGYYTGVLRGFLSYKPRIAVGQAPPPPPQLTFYEDSGLAHYRDDGKGVVLSVRCGPWCGHHAYRKAQGPCDRMDTAPGAGHFVLYLNAEPRLTTPEGAYRLHSFLRSCLLIDGQGQIDDIGYPMSIPAKLHHGEDIESVRWDSATGTGAIRLRLHPAYPKELGLISYIREFLILGNNTILCRDHVVLNRPRGLSWLFQGSRATGVSLEGGLCARFGDAPPLWIQPSSLGVSLTASLHETDVVWSYSSASHRSPFDHVRYDATTPTKEAVVEFQMSW